MIIAFLPALLLLNHLLIGDAFSLLSGDVKEDNRTMKSFFPLNETDTTSDVVLRKPFWIIDIFTKYEVLKLCQRQHLSLSLSQ